MKFTSLLFSVCFLANSLAVAQRVYVVKGDTAKYDITKFGQTFLDIKGQANISQLLAKPSQFKFEEGSFTQYPSKQIWFRFSILNQSPHTSFALVSGGTLNSEMWLVSHNKIIQHSLNGTEIPLAQRAESHAPTAFLIGLPSDTTTIYLMFKSKDIGVYPRAEIVFFMRSSKLFFERNEGQKLYDFVAMAILTAFFFYNLILYFLVKDKSYLYYIALLPLLIVYFYTGGFYFSNHFVLDVYGLNWFYFIGQNLSSPLSLGIFIKFTQAFIQSSIQYPRWHKTLNYCLYGYTMFILIIVPFNIYDMITFGGGFNWLINAMNYLSFGLLLVLMVLSAYLLYHRQNPGFVYAISNLIFIVFTILYVCSSEFLNFYQTNLFFHNALKIGSVLQIIAFSVALAWRINKLRKEIANKQAENEALEKQQAQAILKLTEEKNLELEQKVIERTQALEQSFEEINQQAKLINDQKNRQLMDKTLQVLQKNQAFPEIVRFLANLEDKLDPELQKESKEIQKKITRSLDSDAHWENLKMHFEEVHPTLLLQLNKHCPDLSPNDLRHFAYLRMNLNRKEIAQLLNLDPESVRKHQYRMKQKLKLQPEESLIDFMNAI